MVCLFSCLYCALCGHFQSECRILMIAAGTLGNVMYPFYVKASVHERFMNQFKFNGCSCSFCRVGSCLLVPGSLSCSHFGKIVFEFFLFGVFPEMGIELLGKHCIIAIIEILCLKFRVSPCRR